jgi:gas vesicle protein
MSKNNGSMHSDDDFSRYDRRFREPSGGSRFVSFALGAMIGAAVGAAIALLYAPAEGRDLRQGMSDTLDTIVGGAKDLVNGVKSASEKIFREGLEDEEDEEQDIIERTRERADDIIENADRAIAEARRRSNERRDSMED